MPLDGNRLRAALEVTRGDLVAQRELPGFWTGELAASALSTATAVSALSLVRRKVAARSKPIPQLAAWDQELGRLIVRGLDWLADCQNPDGGWGDTPRSLSNIATTMLVVAAFRLTGVPGGHRDLLDRAEACIDRMGGAAALKKRYGKDRTFAVPILTNCALADMVAWRDVPSLPFELACLPRSWFRFLQLPVVSYAIPALVAIGQAKFHHHRPRNPLVWLVRKAAVARSLKLIETMLPESGGFLEATPLTSFVVMSLATIGRLDHPIVQRSVKFLMQSARPEGAWPIDTNLATWNTTLAVNALVPAGPAAESNRADPLRADVCRESLLEWLLSCQHCKTHLYTGAMPGGWAWTDLSGGVPDVDDTSGALLALARWPARPDQAARIQEAAAAGCRWLLSLQNRDGGWPTFCRGWGAMPFDRSATDLTAHAMRALRAWHGRLGTGSAGRALDAAIDRAVTRGFAFLVGAQRKDGSWIPLWFGNQFNPGEENPVYGTSRVLLAYRDFNRMSDAAAQRGLRWLQQHQNRDGGWGGGPDLDAAFAMLERASEQALARPRQEPDERPFARLPIRSSVEETALAVEALLAAFSRRPGGDSPACGSEATTEASFPSRPEAPTADGALLRGLSWLIDAVETRRYREPSPIGFYFAKLWYFEKLYPIIFVVSALGQAARCPGLLPEPKPAALPANVRAR